MRYEMLDSEMLDSEDHFLLEHQGDVTKGVDRRKFQLVTVLSVNLIFMI
jgi:hypothetical protein